MADNQTSSDPVLDSCPYFRNLEPAERAALMAAGVEIQLDTGESLFGLGDAMPRFFLIVSGEIALTLSMKLREEDKEITVQTQGEGSLIGWSALVKPHQSTMGAKATAPTRLMVLERETLLKIFEDHPRIEKVTQVNIAEIIAGRLRMLEALLIHDLQQWASEVA